MTLQGMTPQVFFSLEAARGSFGPCALSIGNFDGVHLGHQALVAAAKRYAANMRIATAVLLFHPHPTVFVAPTRVPLMICSLEERIRLLIAAGADRVMVLPFNSELARFTPEQFVSQILVGGLRAKGVFVGDNFRFGYQQSGTPATLEQLGNQYEFISYFLRPITFRGQVVSSSLVRRYLLEGRVSLAGRLLGRCFSLDGPVVSGHGIGSKQTVPTLNLHVADGQLTPRGVYVTETEEPSTGRRWQSITNAGVRPTFGGDQLTIETFLLEPLEGNSPQHIRVYFRRFLRAEQTFPDAASLKTQILRDVQRAKIYWNRIRKKS
ncbi:MAG TPA: riboflavin biosynthesis protein RibF [Bryobacteraceae bacterium]|nr:riboflavin biosynthesis protein RibF [Bryobacteraceae bacterium]